MKRRHLLSAVLGLAAATAGLHQAWANEPEAPVVGAPKIIEALTPKDIVLDRPGQPARRGATSRAPSISLQVQFTFDSADLMPQGKRQLDQLAMALGDQALLSAGFELAGHTDKVGDADYNLRLSHARAQAVKRYLSEAHGIAPQRLQTIGYGFSRLIDRAHPQAAINRRVEVRRLIVPVRPSAPGRPAVPTGGRLVPTPN